MNYPKVFDNFFKKGKLDGDYKCVFLDALVDVGLYGSDDLVGKDWISSDGKNMTVDLNFIAIRFIKSYWDVLDLNVQHTVKKNIKEYDTEINILRIIKTENDDPNKIPSLKKLASPGMEDFRKKIIKKSIKPEVLKNLQKDFPEMYRINKKKNSIIFPVLLAEFLKENRSAIRSKIRIKLEGHLSNLNKDHIKRENYIDASNPFFRFLTGNARNVFLMCVDLETLQDQFKTTVNTKIIIQNLTRFKEPVSVWGLRPTEDNRKLWEQICVGDIVLFSSSGHCFTQGIVTHREENEEGARQLWGEIFDDNSNPRLLIVLGDIEPISIDLQNSHIKLTNPAIPNQHNFPIMRVDRHVVDKMISEHGSVEHALSCIPKKEMLYIHDVNFAFRQAIAKARSGQKEFRIMVLENYCKTCAVCDVNQEDLLEAAHIVEVSDLSTAGNIDNGICFCVLHHKMFDRGYMYFNTDYKLIFDDKTPSNLKKSCTKNHITASSCRMLPSKDNLKKSMML